MKEIQYMKKKITIIIPSYNEEGTLPRLISRLEKERKKLSNYDLEYLFISDGSTDDTVNILKEYQKDYPHIRYVDFSRNFGKEIGMLAGFDYSDGDAVVVIDADLQQPPELIKDMIYWWEQGYDDVYAIRKERKGESKLKKWTSKTYYKVLQRVSKEDVYPFAGDFRLLDRKCVDTLSDLRETERYTKGMYGWIGFKKKSIEYDADPRVEGETKWKWSDLMKLAVDGITSYSTVPLKIWSIFGFIISLFAFLYLAYEIIIAIIGGTSPAGYPSVIASILFLGGIQLISLGVIGEYLGRVFVETKNRPLYVVRESSEDKKAKEKLEETQERNL